MAREILSKMNFFDFELADSPISRFPMTLIKSMACLHQGPKVSKAKPLNMKFDEIIELYICYVPETVRLVLKLN
jgi:hypothetical protein